IRDFHVTGVQTCALPILTAELEALKKAGIGGVEITPIYGVYGEEEEFVEYLSPEWVELLKHTLDEAARLGLGVDMATGTGWPFRSEERRVGKETRVASCV